MVLHIFEDVILAFPTLEVTAYLFVLCVRWCLDHVSVLSLLFCTSWNISKGTTEWEEILKDLSAFGGKGLEKAYFSSIHVPLTRSQSHRPYLPAREAQKCSFLVCSGKGNSMGTHMVDCHSSATEGPSVSFLSRYK